MQKTTTKILKGYKQTEIGVIPEDWEVKKLEEIAVVIMGQSPLSKFYNNNGIGLPLIQGNADIENRKTIIKSYTSVVTKKGKAGDIIMSVRAPVGEVSKAMFDCCLGRGVCAISYKNEYIYFYLIYFEKSWMRFSTGSTFDSVNSKQVKELEILMPKLEAEQTAIATVLSDTDALIESLENLIAKKKAIKQGAMQQLLTGKKRLPWFSGVWEEKKLIDIADFFKGRGLSKSKIGNDGNYSCILYGELFTTYSEVIKKVKSKTNHKEGLPSVNGDILMPSSTATVGIDWLCCVETSCCGIFNWLMWRKNLSKVFYAQNSKKNPQLERL